jgi:hypothetical protein
MKAKSRHWINILIGLVLLSSFSTNVPQAAVIDPNGAEKISMSVFLPDGSEAPEDWLPIPGANVRLQVYSPAVVSLRLISATDPSSPRKTTNYPGICTNCPSDPTQRDEDDFKLVNDRLIATDYGGTAVIMVTDTSTNKKATFVFPPDEDEDGIADSWEERSCGSKTCLKRVEDNDGKIESGEVTIQKQFFGDGIAAIDEYRGFMVNGQHVRTHPRQKDLFVYIVRNECRPTPDATSPLGNFDFLANLPNLVDQVHLLGGDPTSDNKRSSEWIDKYERLIPDGDSSSGWVPVLQQESKGPDEDRVINPNAIEPVQTFYQRGVRVIECLVPLPLACELLTSKNCYLGYSGLFVRFASASIVFSQRIREYFEKRIQGMGTTNICSTFQLSTADTFTSNPENPRGRWEVPQRGDLEAIIRKATQFYTAHEIGHALGLTKGQQSDAKNSYGYHNKPYTGDSLDFSIVVRRKEGAQTCTFYLPSRYSPKSHTDFRIRVGQ